MNIKTNIRMNIRKTVRTCATFFAVILLTGCAGDKAGTHSQTGAQSIANILEERMNDEDAAAGKVNADNTENTETGSTAAGNTETESGSSDTGSERTSEEGGATAGNTEAGSAAAENSETGSGSSDTGSERTSEEGSAAAGNTEAGSAAAGNAEAGSGSSDTGSERTSEEGGATAGNTEAGSAAAENVTADTGNGKETKVYENIDVDLSVLSGGLVYSEVYNMMSRPDDYIGKVIKMTGSYSYYHDDGSGMDYHACIIQDATACCAQGIEFVTTKDFVYPDDYPSSGEDITVTGIFDIYYEGDFAFMTLKDAILG